jgi:tRNA-splicing ligase RtcB
MSVYIFGQHDEATVAQIHRCMAVGGTRAVLCADGHKGYAQPIGGVIAYRDLVSISGVGFDIACGNLAIRTNKTGAEVRPKIAEIMDEVVRTISFGMGRNNKERVEHELFDDPHWTEQPFKQLKDIARNQLGTSEVATTTSISLSMKWTASGSESTSVHAALGTRPPPTS